MLWTVCIKLHGTVTTSEHGVVVWEKMAPMVHILTYLLFSWYFCLGRIWEDMNLCSKTIVPHIWLQNNPFFWTFRAVSKGNIIQWPLLLFVDHNIWQVFGNSSINLWLCLCYMRWLTKNNKLCFFSLRF